MDKNIFYVYEHWRPDKDICFYVGKGKGGRAYAVRGRKGYHGNIVKKLHRLGMFAEVRLVKDGLNENAAFTLEIERIAFWKSIGVKLANRTQGGDGALGRRFSKETILRMQNRVFTAEHRAKISASKKGIQKSEAHKNKIAKTLSGRNLDKGHKEKIREGHTLRRIKGGGNWKKGWHHTDEAKAKIGAAAKGLSPWCKGKTLSLETRQKMSAARLGKKRSNPMPESAKALYSSLFKGKTRQQIKIEAEQRRRLRVMEVAR